MRDRGRLALALGAAILLGAAASGPVPWPGGAPPDAQTVRASLDLAIDRWEHDRYLEYNSAVENETETAIAIVLQDQIDRGDFDLETIQRYGRRLIQLPWRASLGLGGEGSDGRLRPVHLGEAPGLDTHACESCHSVGGFDGAGSFTQSALLLGDGQRESAAIRRNPPALLGLGLVQALAAEMSAELAQRREQALEEARRTGEPARVELSAKGVSFGAITARPDGELELGELAGVDPDLVVRPFGWKGDVARLRDFLSEATRTHFGVITHGDALRSRGGPDPRLGGGPDWEDPDGDGVRRELEEGAVSTGALYLALVESPTQLPPADPELLTRWSAGDRLFDAIGCQGCHLRALPLRSRVWEEAPEGGVPYRVDLLAQGDRPRGGDQVALYSDLRRHDLGPGLADPRDDPEGRGASLFLTRPLWGLAETGPWLHDGRAGTLPEAILAHGGEAQASRDAFAALPQARQADLVVFLLSLTRAPNLRVAR